MGQQVFISYSSADKATAERICGALEEAGIACWIAPRNIEPGTDYPTALVEAIRSVRVLVLILTEPAAASPHILSEVGHAFSGKKRIIPFRISQKAVPEDLEYFLSMTQWLDAPEGCTEQNLKRLIESTSAALAGKHIPHLTTPPKNRVRWLAAAVLMLAFIAGGVLVMKLRQPASRNIPPPKTGDLTNLTPRTTQTTSQPKTWTNPQDRLNYVWIPAGTFMMGCSEQDSECKDDEKPTHQVVIEKGFWMGQTEVTIAAYKKFDAKFVPHDPSSAGDLPVCGVSWADAKSYCAATGGRLPTEAEWEYAARAGSPQAYYGVLSEIAWYAKNSEDAPHAVGKKKPNAFGLYDMLGNVWEWVLDRYFIKYYDDSIATGPDVEQPLAPNATAVARGGFWESDAVSLRVSHRLEQEKEGDDIPIGFRCARDHP
jgi:formylglycine-generating enzyme required for sulfatase activity